MARADEYRKLPKIDALLSSPEVAGWVGRYGRAQVVDALRGAVERARERIEQGGACPDEATVLASAKSGVEALDRPTLHRVINATGVVLHTNLGRAPLSAETIAAMAEVAAGYCNLELELATGERGSRYVHCQGLLGRLTGAEAGLVVNNAAAGVLLALGALAQGREVVVSRGQLVEIGGGFRIPDVMRQSGAALVEVGTTNRTYASDYEAAIGPRTAALMVVHRSNFRQTGFVHEPPIEELAALARRHGLVLLDDLGSGTLLDTAAYGLPHEPTVTERVAAGADLVVFSGDKLLGGPQAGYLVGKRSLIETLERFPLLRAVRVDKATLAGAETTLRHYARGEAAQKLPIWRALGQSPRALRERAEGWAAALGSGERSLSVVATDSAVGGGSLPGLTLPTFALSVQGAGLEALAARLRAGDPAVMARIEEGRLLLDPRTVAPGEDAALLGALREVLGASR